MRPHKDVAEMLAVIREGVNLIAPKYEKAVEEMDGADKEESARLVLDFAIINQMHGACGVLEWCLRQNTPAANNVDGYRDYIKSRVGLD